MKILVAGATGAIGRPLIQRLLAHGHIAVGLVRSAEAARTLTDAGAGAAIGDALDPVAVSDAVARERPDVIINQLTALPKHYTPETMEAAAEQDEKVRREGHANLLAAALAAGVRRYLLQSCAFWYAPGPGPADEAVPFAFDASPGVSAGTRFYAELESSLFSQQQVEGVALRYGFLYGPGTWYSKDGDMGEQARRQQVPIIGAAQGVWSFVHVEDAAEATVAALHAPPGVYNIADSEPSEQRLWLPAFARFVGAPDPPHVTEEQTLQDAGPDAVYYATRLRGASSEKASRLLSFRPRPLEWLRL